MSAFENVTDYTDVFTISNTLSGGTLVYALLFTTSIALFLSTIQFGRNKAILFSSFISLFICLILGNMNLLDYWLSVVYLVIFAIAFFMNQQKKNEYGG